MPVNAIYIGDVAACIGRAPNHHPGYPPLYSLKGIKGFAYPHATDPGVIVFHLDGYSLRLQEYTFRFRRENVKFL